MNKRTRIWILLALSGLIIWQLATIAAGTDGAQLVRSAIVAGTSNQAPAKAQADKPETAQATDINTPPLSGINTEAPVGVNKPEGLDERKAAEAIKAQIELADAQQRALVNGSIAGAESGSILSEETPSEDPVSSMAKAIADRVIAGEEITPFDKELLTDYLERTGEDWPSPRDNGNPLDNVGGPDGGDYYYVDSVTPDTATYDWIELRGDPEATWVTAWNSGSDDTYSTSRYGIGFSFPFYGVAQDSVRFATNGFIQFTTTATSLSNSTLPSSNVAGPAIFPYWDDLHLTYGGQTNGTVVAIKNFGNYTVIEYDSIGFCCASGSELKFEVLLFDDGKIKFQYNTLHVVDSEDSSMTIGIQSNGAAGSPALQYCYGSSGSNFTGHYPTNGLAIWFYQFFYDHNFATMSIASPSGYYPMNTAVDVTARFRNAGLTTEGSPVSYSFNGGPVVTENTADLGQNAFEDHTFGTQITTPATPGAYTLTVWTDLATDQARSNDTLRTTITVGGGDCANAITLTGNGPDSLLLNNCGAGDTSPGQPCGASGQDMVFSYDVPNGSQLVVWQANNNNITGRHTLRWGGACPGDNFVDCSTTESRRMRFVNNTGSTQTAWVTVGNTTAPGTCGNLGIGWQLTTCGPASMPFFDGFETTASTPILTDCWGMSNTLTTTNLWENYSTNPRTGTRSASILGNAAANDDWLFSPGFSLTSGTTYIIDFWWRGASATVPESLEVKAGTSNTVGGMTQTVMAMDTIKRTAYIERLVNFVAPTTDIYYFGWHSVTKRSTGRTYIDDVQIYPFGTCSAPTVTVNSVTGQDSAALVATAVGGVGGPPEFQWFTGEGCLEVNRIVDARSATYYAHTSGIYSCRAWIIDSLGCASCDSAIATVIDCSIPVALPWSSGFEGTSGTSFPTCWRVGEYDSDTRSWATTSSNAHSGTRAAYCTYSTAGVIPRDWLFTPPFTLTSGTNYLLDFWWREYLSNWDDSMQVVLTTAQNNVSTVAVIVPEFSARQNPAAYVNSITSFTPPSTGNFYIAFIYQGGDDEGGVVIDDVALTVGGACTAPTVSVADSASIGTVTMFCLATGGSGGALEYQWYTGQTCTPGNEIVGATSATYQTTVSGDYACKAWRFDPDNCSACDWGTATVTPAPPGYDCSNPIVLTTASEDSAQYNNCSMGNNSPGQSCGNSGNDMVFVMVVPDGNTASIYQYFNNIDSRHSLRWGGNCPGDNLVGCIDDPDYTQYTWSNCTGSAQNLYFVVGNYFIGGTCGNFKLRWSNVPTFFCPDITCTPTVTESGTNGGCGGDLTFNPIVCGDVISGTVTANASTRDVDAFELTLAQPQNLVITALSEFDAILEVRTAAVGTPCPDVLRQTINAFGNCAGETRTLYEVPAGLVHVTITSTFVESCGPQNYCLTVNCEPSSPPPGETCENPIVLTPPTPGVPTVFNGDNTGFTLSCRDTCNAGVSVSAPDVFLSFTLASCRRITIALDNPSGTPSNDMQVSVAEEGHCCGQTILCDDDLSEFDTLAWETPGQRPASNLSSFVGGELPAGTYIIRASYYGSLNTGPYRVTVYDNGPCGCDLSCQGGDVPELVEDRYDWTYYLTDPDGGCNSEPDIYGAITIGQTVCGVGFNYLHVGNQYRDTDWYTFSLAQPASMVLTVNAEFIAQYGIISGPAACPNPPFAAEDTALQCEPTTISVNLAAGDYAMFVAPLMYIGNPTPSTYRATLRFACDPDTVANLTVYLANLDGDPTANDIRLKWTAQDAFDGTYKVYANTTLDVFPGTWQEIATGLTPVFGPNAMEYVHDDAVAGSARRFYLVVSQCAGVAAAASRPVTAPELAK